MRPFLTLVTYAMLSLTAACSNSTSIVHAGRDSVRSERFAEAALAGGLPQAALHATRTILERDPNNVQALIQQGDALSALGRYDVAAEAYRRAVSNDPESRSTQARRARLGLGRVTLESGHPAAAESLFRSLTTMFPDDPKGYDGLGIALDLQGKHQEAQAEYKAALERGESDGTRVNLGLSLALAGNTDDALVILRPIAASQDSTPKVRQNLAVALTLAGDDAAAKRVLSQDLPGDQVIAAMSGYHALRLGSR